MDTSTNDPIAVMTLLDELVVEALPDNRYTAARTLYAAVVAGLIAVPIPERVLYRWLLKWAGPAL